MSFLDPSFYTSFLEGNDDSTVIGIAYGSSAFFLLFYPVAGYLADVRWGRYKAVVNGLSFIFYSILLVIFLICLATVASIPIIVKDPDYSSLGTIQTISTIILCVVFGLPILFGLVLTFCSLVAFNANVIQFGTDQLHMHTMLPQVSLCSISIGMCGRSMFFFVYEHLTTSPVAQCYEHAGQSLLE